MSYMYVVEHYVPFPQSEYGGQWVVIARDDEECFDLIAGDDLNYLNEMHYGQLRENINKAEVHALHSSDVRSQIVKEFIT